MTVRVVFGLALVLATAGLFDPRIRRVLARPEAYQWVARLFVTSRLVGWLASYVLLASLTQHTDLILYYYPEAIEAWGGRLPYVDYPTSYGPFFPYVSGALLWGWNSPAAVALVMVAIEIVAVLFLTARIRRDREMPRHAGTWTLAIYLLNPAALYWSGMMAYNSPIILLSWVMAVRFLLRDRHAAGISWLAGSVLAGKFLGLLAAPIWIAHPGRRVGVIAGATTAAAVAVVVGLQYDVNLLLPLLREGDRSTGGNFWFLVGGLLPTGVVSPLWRYGPVVMLGAGAAGLCGLWARAWRVAPSLRQLSAALSALGWLFVVLSKKSFPHYAPMFLLFTVAVASADCPPRPRWVVMLAVIGAIGIVEPGLWNAMGQPVSLGHDVRTGTGTWMALALTDVLLVVGGVMFAAESARQAVLTPPAAEEAA